jgi:hypothetical protein
MKASTRGAIWATAVAVAFIANLAPAEESTSSPQPTLVACLGVNSCKGQSACKSFDHDCQAMNTCKGKGFILTTEDECKQKGGKIIDPDQM